jgi:pyruvate dehydrogenase kinase 2/3/4
MQQLPYVVVTNPHINEVYDLYYSAFDTFRKVREIKNLQDNEQFCDTIRGMLKAHLPVIPKLAMGILECSEVVGAEELDNFMNTILKAVRTHGRLWIQPLIVMTITAHISPGDRRTTSGLDGYLPRSMVLSRS